VVLSSIQKETHLDKETEGKKISNNLNMHSRDTYWQNKKNKNKKKTKTKTVIHTNLLVPIIILNRDSVLV